MAVAASTGYPLSLSGRLDAPPGRWLWLVKWLLLVPHLLVLMALWVAVAVVTVVAGFAILFTGRYPRSLFDFTVGVLRWTWRVSFYATGAFATDKYPPFSFEHDDDFPADLDVEYPAHLSRGLVLVKWWLLAIPHYLVVGLLAGGAHIVAGGLITVLAVVAIVLVMFRRGYPRELFDLIVGFDRWCFRVAAYALLLTDRYPPFRLDMGGSER